jgi:hypothetical protein
VKFTLFALSRVDTFAKDMAHSVTRRYPPVVANNPEQTVPQKRIEEILKETFAGARQFQRENRLGLLGRAKLGNTFKWELREIGYEEKFVDFATKKIIEQIMTGAE